MKPCCVSSVRPPTESFRSGGGPGVEVDKQGIEKRSDGVDSAMKPVFPVEGVADDEIAADVDPFFDELCAPCEDLSLIHI